MIDNQSVAFFDEQFQRQLREADLKLNSFEELTLPYLAGDVLDFGCGLGNLALAAASRGCNVDALDGSPAAIAHIQALADAGKLAIAAAVADLRQHQVSRVYDCVVSIGLLMFFDCVTAGRVLHQLQSLVRPGGLLAINVLVEGTTYLDMFDRAGYCLFNPAEFRGRFKDWEIMRIEPSEFAAPGQTVKRFLTLIARRAA
ncbi:MAG: methyltransferase domain-containing protein [Proteobacteria bacterium]|nr:methyltransferase domain-containing protein [Pseudomonadota bacterium]